MVIHLPHCCHGNSRPPKSLAYSKREKRGKMFWIDVEVLRTVDINMKDIKVTKFKTTNYHEAIMIECILYRSSSCGKYLIRWSREYLRFWEITTMISSLKMKSSKVFMQHSFRLIQVTMQDNDSLIFKQWENHKKKKLGRRKCLLGSICLIYYTFILKNSSIFVNIVRLHLTKQTEQTEKRQLKLFNFWLLF